MENFVKVVGTIFGVLNLIPSLLVLLGLISADLAPEILTGLGGVQQALIALVTGIAGIIGIFGSGTEPGLSSRNIWPGL